MSQSYIYLNISSIMRFTKNGSPSNATKNIIALQKAIKLLFNYVSMVKIYSGSVILRWATASPKLNTWYVRLPPLASNAFSV